MEDYEVNGQSSGPGYRYPLVNAPSNPRSRAIQDSPDCFSCTKTVRNPVILHRSDCHVRDQIESSRFSRAAIVCVCVQHTWSAAIVNRRIGIATRETSHGTYS